MAVASIVELCISAAESKLSGSELVQVLGNLRPDLKTIYMSGYADEVVLQQGIHDLGAVFLQKPFSLNTLARKVRSRAASEVAGAGICRDFADINRTVVASKAIASARYPFRLKKKRTNLLIVFSGFCR